MKTPILIADDNDYIRSKIRAALENGPYELIEASSGEEALMLTRTALPALIFMDIHMPGIGGLEAVRRLKSDPLTREIPVIHLTLSEDERLREESLQTGADGFIRKPFFDEEIQSKTRALITRRGRYTTSYTARFIRSLIVYAGTRFSAARMTNIGHQICRALEIDEEAEKDVLQAARLLSCAAKDGNPARVMALYEEMGFARAVAGVLTSDPAKSLPSAIAWALFVHECAALKTPFETPAFGARKGVLDQIGELYAAPAVTVESPQDLDYAEGEFFQMAADKPEAEVRAIWRLLGRVLAHELAYHGGALFFRHEDRLSIRPKDGVVRTLCLERITLDDPALKNRLKEDRYLGKPVLTLELSPAKQPIATPAIASSSETVAGLPKKLDAKTFLADSPIGADEIEDLRLLENDMFELLEEISYTHHPKEALLHLNALLSRYGSILMVINEFSSLASNLMAFCTELAGLEHLDDGVMKKLSVLIAALVGDLREWRQAIFVRKDAADIHFLDSSLLADCDQCLSALHTKEATGNTSEDELELF